MEASAVGLCVIMFKTNQMYDLNVVINGLPFQPFYLLLYNHSIITSQSLHMFLFSDQLEQEARGQVRGEAQGSTGEPLVDPEWTLKQEREEHRQLLADSHSTSLDLRWKLQHGEKKWSCERAELMERFDQERQEWSCSMRELHHKMEKVREGGRKREGGIHLLKIKSTAFVSTVFI